MRKNIGAVTGVLLLIAAGASSAVEMTAWVDDALPAGAVPGSSGGDTWNWVISNPTPAFGGQCTLSSLGSGLHEHFFYSATQTLAINSGEVLYAFVYLDPANPPSEIMLQWLGDSWEHRAYWGANNINNGISGTASRVYMGPLPAAGGWQLLQVPASQVGLEGETLKGMAFSQYDGRAAWDYAGKASGPITNSGSGGSNGTTNTAGSANNAMGVVNPVIWMDDNVPAGATSGSEGGDSWNWVTSDPAPYSGTQATLSSIAPGFHQYFFSSATAPLPVNSGEVLFAYVYVDPSNVPNELMLQWNDGSWEHRAYWGANNINSGTQGTASRVYMGPMPAAGNWTLLAVPASAVGLEGATLNGMAFSQYGGRAAWDSAGKGSGLITTNTSGTGGGGASTNTTDGSTLVNPIAWVEDALPAGAVPGSEGGDSWNWITSNPTPYSGTRCTLSSLATGLHSYLFSWASPALNVNNGEILFAYVYLDPNNPPSEVMLQYLSDSWEHRAYWGANNINNGTPGTSGRVYMGPLPPAGRWALLQVPASQLGLEGASVNGMAFSQHGGRAAWDYAGKASGVTGGGNSSGTGSGTGGSTNNLPTNTLFTAWVEDGLPGGAESGAEGGDSWNWVSTGLTTPYSGSKYSISSIAADQHQYFFGSASQTLAVNAGDVLCAAVYVDPNNVPSELMLQWNDGRWDHRAYWGADNINYGIAGTTTKAFMGPMPASGQWVLLQVPAAAVGLEGRTLQGMAFSQYGGRAGWDYAGKLSLSTGGSTGTGGGTNTNGSGGSTNTNGGGSTSTTNIVSTGTNTASWSTNADPSGLPGVSAVDYITPKLPKVGDNALHVLTPTLLELKMINTVPQGGTQVTHWDLVDGSTQFRTPPTSGFAVTADGSAVGVTSVGFKRRPIYAPLVYDLRVENSLYLQLSGPISDNQVIEVRNTDGSLWNSNTKYLAKVDPLRYSPALHVNQEGYMPNYTKKAVVGYYAGCMGEVTIPASAGFKLVDATTGAQVFQGTLARRTDSGYTYSPTPYQEVYEADFTSFNTPGQYRLVVPGMGGSLPFRIHEGIAMSFARAYALGLYHQRCGTACAMPYTRFTHDVCHAAPASVPTTASGYSFTWNTIAGYASTINQNNPPQIAPALTSPATQLFPFANQGPVNVAGGHHDAGDYSKYTSNSANLTHYLMFAVDSLPGVAALDNLGIPESGDGISDVLQEAKWEADYIAKLQDTDGGFYFLVYPKEREYELDVTPDHGDPQVVWPKTTSVTAASVAALAQCASSPAFKAAYPDAAATYLQKARLGWQFLMNAINRYGKNGAYQKITHYADNFADNDELAWAACQMYLATGDSSIHQLLLSWFDPSDPATWHWGWWHMSECYGHAIRSYAFAVQSGRVTAGQLDPTFLAKCRAEITAAGDAMLSFSQQNAYGSSFPNPTKAVRAAGWYFSTDQAFDLAVAYAQNPRQDYLNAILANMNYEGGCNPVNVCYLTGLGWRRQRDLVSQWALNDTRVMPPSGIPIGNIGATFGYLWYYGGILEALCFPSDGAANAPYPFYDRWGDSWNVNNEMVVLNQARSMAALGFLAAQTSYRSQTWRAPANARINVPSGVAQVGVPLTLSFQVPGIDLSGARITWEARDHEPAYGTTFICTPSNNGVQWVEAEAQLPDGRRIFAKATFNANAPDIVWVEDSIPAGATARADGGDAWNWTSSNPAPHSGTMAHTSVAAAGSHQHLFQNANATLTIGTGDVLYAWVYLDPANMPSQIMLQWNDGRSWDHRAYWGANNLSYGADGTPGRVNMGPLPAAGQWVQLRVPAAAVGLEGATLTGMSFTLFGGAATWDTAGRLSSSTGVASSISVNAATTVASRTTLTPGLFTLTRAGDTNLDVTINFTLGGRAVGGADYQLSPTGGLSASSLTIPAGATSASLEVLPLASTNFVSGRDLILTLSSNVNYTLAAPVSAVVTIGGNTLPVKLSVSTDGPRLTWDSIANRTYQIGFKNNLTDPNWTMLGRFTARYGTSSSSWPDPNTTGIRQRFYCVGQIN